MTSTENTMKLSLIILSIAGCLILSFCSKAQCDDMVAKKTPTILANLLNSKDPVNFANTHGIKLKDGMVRVVMIVDERFASRAFVSKYGLKEYKKRKNLIAAYVTIDSLKELCKEPSVVFIRLPVKFNPMGKSQINKVDIER